MARQDCGAIHDEMWTYHCAPSIIWVREFDQIQLIDNSKGESWIVQGIEATIWDLLVLAYPYKRMIAFLSVLLDLSVEETKSVLLTDLAKWQRQGIVEVSNKTGNGELGNQCRL